MKCLHWLSFPLACALLAQSAWTTQESTLDAEIAALASSLGEPHAPGGIVGVLRDGKPIAVHAFGLADVAAERPIDATTPFYIASTAKQFTAACVAHAAAAGKLSLDDSITKHVAGLPEAYRAVTLRHLMHHRSGVMDIYELVIALDLGRDAIASNTATIDVLRRIPALDFAPGERFLYSNSGYVLLAEALRSATGKTLGAYASAHFFEPLRMTRARIGGEPRAEDARSYRGDAGALESIEIVSGLVGPGGMWASFDDLAHWDEAWNGKRVPETKVRDSLLSPPPLAAGRAPHPVFGPYAGGVMVGTWRGVRTIRHAGGAFGFSAEYMRFPDSGISVIAMSNRAQVDARRLAESAAAIALKDTLAKEPSALPDSESIDRARFGRMWRDERSGMLWAVTLRPDRQQVASLGDVKLDVAIDSPTRLVATRNAVPVTIDFEPAEGTAQRMTVRVDGVLVAACRPITLPPRELPPAADYEGEYRSESLPNGLRIRAEGTSLVIVQTHAILPAPPFLIPPFQPLGNDLFACDLAQLQFTRDEHGSVSGVQLDTNRVRGLVFTRR